MLSQKFFKKHFLCLKKQHSWVKKTVKTAKKKIIIIIIRKNNFFLPETYVWLTHHFLGKIILAKKAYLQIFFFKYHFLWQTLCFSWNHSLAWHFFWGENLFWQNLFLSRNILLFKKTKKQENHFFFARIIFFGLNILVEKIFCKTF